MGYLKRRIIEAMEPKEEPPVGYMKDLDIRIRNGGDDAIAAVSELMPRWVPLSERLPEQHERCLVADAADEDLVGIAYWHEGPQSFAHEDIDNAWTPTHWMQLPEPPVA